MSDSHRKDSIKNSCPEPIQVGTGEKEPEGTPLSASSGDCRLEERGLEEVSDSEHVVFCVRDNVAWIYLGPPSEKIAVLTKSRMASLAQALEKVEEATGLLGLVITGASAGGFCAGADIQMIKSIQDPLIGEDMAKIGQAIFQRIESLKITTVALIRGACVGGGCELALSCRYRLLLDSDETRIGLPEVKLGILPGFGGSQRLPRLIGLPRALDIILKGKVVSAKEALKLGLADRLVPPFNPQGVSEKSDQEQEAFEKAALDVIVHKKLPVRKKLPIKDYLLTHFPAGRAIVSRSVTATLARETKGHYPAPMRALKVVVDGLKLGTETGYRLEAKALGELIATPECGSLVHVFLISESAGKLGRKLSTEIEALDSLVLGAGVMGAGIAQAFLQKNHQVTLIDTFPGAIERGVQTIRTGLEKRRSLSAEKRTEILKRLNTFDSYERVTENALANVQIVVEAIVEDLQAKKELFSRILPAVHHSAIVASNTSSLSITSIAEGLSEKVRVVGMHFFNPVDKMPLVEVVRGENTDEKTILLTAALATHLGKFPIVVTDCPGFLVNRILTPYLTEAAILLGEGVSVRDIDNAATNFGMPMGPIRLLDEVGLDVAAKVSEILEKAYGERMRGPAFAETLLKLGRKGKKTGQGFYTYSEKTTLVSDDLHTLLDLPLQPDAWVRMEDLENRLIFPMLNEAVRCLDEGVAGFPGPQAACQIDLGSVMGTGFAPFRGGIIHYAEALGSERVLARFQELTSRYGKRFQPARGIEVRGAQGLSFYEPIRSPEP